MGRLGGQKYITLERDISAAVILSTQLFKQFGHREADERLLPRLGLVIDWLIQEDDVRHGASNSRNLLEYARRREGKDLIQIINIAEYEADK